MKRILTIGRQFGSGGREIGQLVAKKLGVNCYDRTLIDLTAKAGGYDLKTLESIDETTSKNFFIPIPIAHYTNYSGTMNYTLNDKIFLVQSEIIQQIAQRESAVIVGRCANYVLAGRDDVLNVFIYADKELRIKNIAERQYIDLKSAQKLVAKTDRKRASYYKYYTGNTWGDSGLFDLLINSAMGVEKVADIILAAMK
jgi:cytidylate kinase